MAAVTLTVDGQVHNLDVDPGMPACSCSMPVAAVSGAVTTIEGLASGTPPHPLQQAAASQGA